MVTFGSAVVAHVPKLKQVTGRPTTIFHYTSKAKRKHFPHREVCAANNMALKSITKTASDIVILTGKELQVDIKVFVN